MATAVLASTAPKAAGPLRALIGPSLLASDLANMGAEAQRVMDLGADYLHLDLMDGHFVPNISWGPPVVQALRKHIPSGKAVFDCHLMVSEPEKWVGPMQKAGADVFTFHVEAMTERGKDVGEVIAQVKAANMKVGLALKPGTPVEAVEPFLSLLDLVLVMTVEPGFGGQSFMSPMMSKVSALRKLAPGLNVEVDGGLNQSTVQEAAAAGANMIVAGSSVFKSENIEATIKTMRASVVDGGVATTAEAEAGAGAGGASAAPAAAAAGGD